MPWLSLLSGLVKLTGIVAGMVERRGLMKQGEVRAIANQNAKALKNVEKAIRARRSVDHSADSVRQDPNRRD